MRDGFVIVDNTTGIPTYDCPNYISPSSGTSFDYVDHLIREELSDQKYIVAKYTPTCIHSVGVVPKPDGKFRPITDCKRPIGSSINNYMSNTCGVLLMMCVTLCTQLVSWIL